MSKIVLSGHILVPEAEISEVRDALNLHQELTRKEIGCLIFNVEEDPDMVGKFNVYEEFVDRQAFENHQQRVKDSAWGEVSRNFQRFYTVEEVRE